MSELPSASTKNLSGYPEYFKDQTLLDLAKKVTTLVFDIDGVFTDGGLYLDPAGNLSKRFDVQDGLGIVLARKAGFRIAVITGQKSEAVSMRMEILKITDYYAGYIDKRDSIAHLKDKYQLEWSQMAYLGDDWIDLPPMLCVGLPVAVQNALPEVKQHAKIVTTAQGGHGAVREFTSFMLHSHNKLQTIIETFTKPTECINIF